MSTERKIVEATFIALTDGGRAVGEVTKDLENRLGKKIFVRYVIPGETAEVEIEKEEKNFLEGNLLKITKSSSERVEAPCAYFGVCGGCDLQHINEKSERKLKLEMIDRTLKVQLKDAYTTTVKDLSQGLPFYNYRKKILLHVSETGELGFYKNKSGEVVEINKCLLAKDEINAAIPKAKDIASRFSSTIGSIILELTDEQLIFIFIVHPEHKADLAPLKKYLLESKINFRIIKKGKLLDSSDNNLHIAAGNFSQVNPEGNKILVDIVCEFIRSDFVLEFYAGAGNFTIPLAQRGKSLEAVELSEELTKAGKTISISEGVSDKKQFVTTSTEKYIKRGVRAKSILLDPPRSGAKLLCDAIDPKFTEEIVYVSCSLPTLVRDLKVLTQKGYKIEQLFFVDMFPRTNHVETITVLRI